MKLFEITNGYVRYSDIRIHVVAETEERAVELARIAFKKEISNEPDGLKRMRFWSDLTIVWQAADLSQEFVSGISD
jgi:hypothetical protein